MLQIIYLLLTVYSNNVEFLRLKSLVTTKEIFKPSYIYLRKSMYLMIPIAEEMIFRKWTYDFLKTRTKFYNLIQAFLFALFHFILVQSIYAFISGIFLGNIKRKTDSLETVIFCHSFYNLSGLPYLGYIYYYPIELIVKKFLHTENFIVMAIALSILPIIGFIWSWKKLGKDLYKL